jgi:hypothetical protein
VIGSDIGKNSFHVVGHDERGAIVLRQKWSRGQVEARLANMPPCLIGMTALTLTPTTPAGTDTDFSAGLTPAIRQCRSWVIRVIAIAGQNPGMDAVLPITDKISALRRPGQAGLPL